MVYINEWLSNPAGADAQGEFVELYNSGATRDLSGWSLVTSNAKKRFVIEHATIAANGYLVLPRSATKLSLKNSNESLWLYDAAGRLVDMSSFFGSAPEARSFSRTDYSSANMQHFTFAFSTPGAPNDILNNQVSAASYPFNTPINARLNTFTFFEMMMGAAVAVTALALYAIKSNENISKRVFERYQEIGERLREGVEKKRAG